MEKPQLGEEFAGYLDGLPPVDMAEPLDDAALRARGRAVMERARRRALTFKRVLACDEVGMPYRTDEPH